MHRSDNYPIAKSEDTLQGGPFMKRNSIRLLTAALLLAGAQQAFAAGTDAGTEITSTFTVNYDIGGVAQAELTPSYTSFLVDRRVNVAVAADNSPLTVSPNAADQVLQFTVTNSTNSVLDIGLTVANGAGDAFDPTNVSIFVESGATVGYQLAEDTATFVDELAEDATKVVYVVGDIPGTAANTETGAIVLTATAKASGVATTEGAALLADVDADDPAVVENVFGDAAGATDSAEDGKHSATGVYSVTATTINVTKTSVVIDDPFNLTTNPKAIPGATIQYCISVQNTGGTAATNVAVDDPIPVGTTYVVSSIKVGADCVYASATAEDDDNTGLDETDGISGSKDVSGVHTLVNNLPGSSTTTTLFRVTVD